MFLLSKGTLINLHCDNVAEISLARFSHMGTKSAKEAGKCNCGVLLTEEKREKNPWACLPHQKKTFISSESSEAIPTGHQFSEA